MTKKGPRMEAFFLEEECGLGYVHQVVSFDI